MEIPLVVEEVEIEAERLRPTVGNGEEVEERSRNIQESIGPTTGDVDSYGVGVNGR